MNFDENELWREKTEVVHSRLRRFILYEPVNSMVVLYNGRGAKKMRVFGSPVTVRYFTLF